MDYESIGHSHETQRALAISVSLKSIAINAVLTVFKLAAGVISNSSAMISDGIHTASDVLSTVVVIAGVNIAGKKPDKGHPYGHERFESVAAIILSVTLLATGIGIGYGGAHKILQGLNGELAVPGVLALVAAIVSIAVKEWMFWFTRAAAKKSRSDAVMADAWHHRSDALSSVGSLVGIAGARMGLPILDPLACLVICLFIVKTALEIFRDAVNKVVDQACDDDMVQRMSDMILARQDVQSLDDIKTRQFGTRVYVDVEIGVDGGMDLHRAHSIAHSIHDEIEENFSDVKHCMVHVNPQEKETL